MSAFAILGMFLFLQFLVELADYGSGRERFHLSEHPLEIGLVGPDEGLSVRGCGQRVEQSSDGAAGRGKVGAEHGRRGVLSQRLEGGVKAAAVDGGDPWAARGRKGNRGDDLPGWRSHSPERGVTTPPRCHAGSR